MTKEERAALREMLEKAGEGTARYSIPVLHGLIAAIPPLLNAADTLEEEDSALRSQYQEHIQASSQHITELEERAAKAEKRMAMHARVSEVWRSWADLLMMELVDRAYDQDALKEWKEANIPELKRRLSEATGFQYNGDK